MISLLSSINIELLYNIKKSGTVRIEHGDLIINEVNGSYVFIMTGNIYADNKLSGNYNIKAMYLKENFIKSKTN